MSYLKEVGLFQLFYFVFCLFMLIYSVISSLHLYLYFAVFFYFLIIYMFICDIDVLYMLHFTCYIFTVYSCLF